MTYLELRLQNYHSGVRLYRANEKQLYKTTATKDIKWFLKAYQICLWPTKKKKVINYII